jgi:hypothetical protein
LPNRSSYLAYIYLLRVPILTWLLLVVLSILGMAGNSVVLGLFDLAPQTQSPFILSWRFGLLALSAALASVGIAMTSWLVLIGGDERFATGPFTGSSRELWLVTSIALVPAATVFGGAFFVTGSSAKELWHGWPSAAGGVSGFAAALLICWLVFSVRHRVRPLLIAALLVAVIAIVLLVFDMFKTVWGAVSIVILILLGYGAKSFADAAKAHAGHPGGRSVVSGYLKNGELEPLHLLAASMMTLSFLVYAVIGRFRFRNPTDFGVEAFLPTLVMVVIWSVLACYVLASATFFLDFFRIPLLLVLGGYAVFVGQSPEGDHFYHTQYT